MQTLACRSEAQREALVAGREHRHQLWLKLKAKELDMPTWNNLAWR